MIPFQTLFIILFLHQTTTAFTFPYYRACCLSSCSYIKPQPFSPSTDTRPVVYHLVPTSNHNIWQVYASNQYVVYHLVPTSNHNSYRLSPSATIVVYHLVPTSNHNLLKEIVGGVALFIILFLHQTTTKRCTSFVTILLFIILFLHQTTTQATSDTLMCALFIILFLHQTTTSNPFPANMERLFIILFLHQTTTRPPAFGTAQRCLSSCSYIKPQLCAVPYLIK